jgi:hypothetical protein
LQGDAPSGDFREDVVDGCGPHEGLGIVVVGVEVGLDGGDQVGYGMEDSAA